MSSAPPSRRLYAVPLRDGHVLELGQRPLVMGILNVTPDSFAEWTPRLDPATAAEWALRMEAEGADILDIGGESTRPGATPVPADEEAARVMPVIKALVGQLRVPISIDTYKSSVARQALDAGASLVNDVSGLRYDPGLAAVVAEHEAALIVMHMRGRSREMYGDAEYGDIVTEVAAELRDSMSVAMSAGVSQNRIIVDPGIGFAKQAADSYRVLAHLPHFAASLDRPLLAGPSRKSFMSGALGNRPPHERDWGTAAAVTAAVLAGAHIVRVHAVGAMAQVVRVAEEIRNAWIG